MRNMTLFVGLLLATTGVAYADDGTTVIAPSRFVELVPYHSGDLATAESISDLRHRVRSASWRVCGSNTADTPATQYTAQRCLHPTLMDAFAQVDRAVANYQLADAAPARIRVAAR